MFPCNTIISNGLPAGNLLIFPQTVVGAASTIISKAYGIVLILYAGNNRDGKIL